MSSSVLTTMSNAPTYLDILRALPRVSNSDDNNGETIAHHCGTGVASAAPVSPVVERFRSISSNMQTVADASIKVETDRIISLPIMPDPTEEEIDLVSRWYCPDGSLRLFSEQAKAMMQYHDFGSLVCPVSVGGGKTLISVLVANDAFSVFGKKKILLIIPSHLVNQLRHIELPKYRTKYKISINVPFYWLAGETAAKRMQYANSKRAGCYVVSYSLLSRQDGAELMNAIEPDLVIGDEIHRIASANPSARGRRFKEIVKRFSPDIVGLSGTITTKSPRDYHFLVTNALRERSFIPRPVMLADEWAKIIDSNASNINQFDPSQRPQTGDLNTVVEWAGKHFPNETFKRDLVGFRNAHSARMRTCPGVITSNGKDLVGSSLLISNVKISKQEKEASPGWDRLKDLVKNLIDRWVAPNGDELEYAMHIWRFRYELEGIGGYNDLSWPLVEKIAERRRISVPEAQEYLTRSQYHHRLHQEYSKKLRDWIKRRAKTGLDTPMLIGADMYRNGAANVGKELFEAWKITKEAEFPEIVERDESFVRVCDFRIKKIVTWAEAWYKENPGQGAVIWFDNRGVGAWLRDAFKEAGLPYVYCPADTAGRKNISDETKKDHFALATFNAFSEGLNIQHMHYAAFYSQWPRSAKIAEQSIGRLHRPGQKADEVQIYQSICSEFDSVLFAACLNDAAYAHQSVEGRQKLMYADYAERPKLIPYAVMVEWGAMPEQQTTASVALLEEKFKEKE